MVEFGSSADFKNWMLSLPNDRRRLAARALSLRAALRVLPLNVRAGRSFSGTNRLGIRQQERAFASCRAISCVLTGLLLPTSLPNFSAIAYDAVRAAFKVIGRMDADGTGAAAYAARATADYEATEPALDAATNAAKAAVFVADSAAFSIGADTTYAVLSADATEMEADWSKAADVLTRPLWPTGQPEWATKATTHFLTTLLNAGDDWDVWARWYQDRLNGVPPDPDFILAIARIPDADWDKGPAHVNAIIKRLEDEARRRLTLKPLTSLPKEQLNPLAMGARFEIRGDMLVISYHVDEDDLAAAKSPVVQQLHRSLRDKARSFAQASGRVETLEGWAGLPGAASKFADAVDQDLLAVAGLIVIVWERTVELGTFLEQVGRIAADPRTNMPNLPHDIIRELESLIRVAAPWVRRFPTAEALDDDAGAFLASTDLFNSANALFEAAAKHRLINEQDRQLLKDLFEAIRRGEFQGRKANNRLIGSAKNLMMVLAGFYAGMIGNNAAPESIIATKGAEVVLEVEAYALDLFENPPDMRAAIKSMIDDIKLQKEEPQLTPNRYKPGSP